MAEESFGELIRRLRKEHHLTQADLSGAGIVCDTSTISLVENDRWAPSWKLFHRLMEQIEGPGYFYSHFLSKEEGCREELRVQIEEYLYLENREAAAVLLGDLKKILDDDPPGQRYFEIAKLICFNEANEVRDDYIDECHRIFLIGKESDFLIEHLEKLDTQIRFSRRDTDRLVTDTVDLLILNNLAIGHLWKEEYASALKILQYCQLQIDSAPYIRMRQWRMRGTLYYNSALTLFYMEEYQRTEEYLENSFKIGMQSGGVALLLRIVRLYLRLLCETGDDAYAQDWSLYQTIMKRVPIEEQLKNCSEEMFVL